MLLVILVQLSFMVLLSLGLMFLKILNFLFKHDDLIIFFSDNIHSLLSVLLDFLRGALDMLLKLLPSVFIALQVILRVFKIILDISGHS